MQKWLGIMHYWLINRFVSKIFSVFSLLFSLAITMIKLVAYSTHVSQMNNDLDPHYPWVAVTHIWKAVLLYTFADFVHLHFKERLQILSPKHCIGPTITLFYIINNLRSPNLCRVILCYVGWVIDCSVGLSVSKFLASCVIIWWRSLVQASSLFIAVAVIGSHFAMS